MRPRKHRPAATSIAWATAPLAWATAPLAWAAAPHLGVLGLLAACAVIAPSPLAGATVTQLTSPAKGEKSWNSEPSWSPDGKRIVYTHATWTGANAFTSWIEVVEVENGKRSRYPRQETGDNPAANTHASWSPDGKRIVFTAPTGVMLTTGDAGSPTLLVPGPVPEAHPTWSLDGAWIAFEKDGGEGRVIWLLPPIGGESQLLSPPKGPMVDPAWSPDGKRIACAVWGERGRDLWIVPLGGGTWRAVTRDAHDDASPAWSPDGSTIAFVSDRGGNRDVWLVPASGGEPVQLTDAPGDDIDPCWSPDGKRLAFASTRSGELQIWIAADLPPASLLQRSWRAPKTVER